jgi:hypothetical protein
VFESQFSSVATGLLIAEESFVKNTINVGTNTTGNANITIAGGSASPYLSIGQATKSYASEGIFLGTVAGEATLSLTSNTNHLKWNGDSLDIKGDIGGTIGNIDIGTPTVNGIRISSGGIQA